VGEGPTAAEDVEEGSRPVVEVVEVEAVVEEVEEVEE